jgi:hypothetical protein
MTAQVVPQFSVIEQVTALYGDLDLMVQFMLDNPDIGTFGINADLEQFTGVDVLYDPGLANFIPAPLSFAPPGAQTDIGVVVAQPDTISVYDLCIQSYGTLDLLSKLMVDNAIQGVSQIVNGEYGYNILQVQSSQRNQYNAFNSIIYATLYSVSTQTPSTAVILLETALGQGGGYILLEDGNAISLENQN